MKKIISSEQLIEIINYYKVPNTLSKTAEHFNMDSRTLRKILVLNNVELHQKELENKLAKADKVQCTVCGLFMTKANIKKHINSHENGYLKYYLSKNHQSVTHDGLNCIYCSKECKNKNSLAQHECRCKENPNRYLIPIGAFGNNKGHIAWNKGLTANTDERVKKGRNSLKSRYDNKTLIPSQLGKSHTSEEKLKISTARKKYLNEHPEKVPFKLNHSSKQSYPEKYFETWLRSVELFDEKEFQVSRYTLDFAWPESKTYLEIDGSQHHLSWMIEHDKIRTIYLQELGWCCIERIYWPDYQKLSQKEKEILLNNLYQKIKSAVL